MTGGEFSADAFGLDQQVKAAEQAAAAQYADDLFAQQVAPLHDAAYVAAGALLSARNTWTVVQAEGAEPEFRAVTTGLLAVGDDHLDVAPSGHVMFPAVEVTLMGPLNSGGLLDRAKHKLPGLPDTWQKVPKNWHPGIGMGRPLFVRSYDVTNHPAPDDAVGWTHTTERAQDGNILLKAITPEPPDAGLFDAVKIVRPLDCYVRPRQIFTKNGKATSRLWVERSDLMQPNISALDLPEDAKAAAEVLAGRAEERAQEAAANVAVLQGLGAAALMPVRRLVKNKGLRQWWRGNNQRAADNLPAPLPPDGTPTNSALLAYYAKLGLPLE
jgi:hypothetical protein